MLPESPARSQFHFSVPDEHPNHQVARRMSQSAKFLVNMALKPANNPSPYSQFRCVVSGNVTLGKLYTWAAPLASPEFDLVTRKFDSEKLYEL